MCSWEIREFKKEEQLITKGATPSFVYVLLSGECVVDEKDIIIRGAGEMLGEMSLLEDDQLAQASVSITSDAARLISIPREQLFELKESIRDVKKARLEA